MDDDSSTCKLGSRCSPTGLPTVTFRYKSWVEKDTREKSFQDQTIDVYEFMARMLLFLPDPNQKMIRYYGIYSNRIMVRHACLDAAAHQPDNSVLSQRTWAQAIENSFDAKPQNCPDCAKKMNITVVYSYSARKTMDALKGTHAYLKGYYRPKSRAP